MKVTSSYFSLFLVVAFFLNIAASDKNHFSKLYAQHELREKGRKLVEAGNYQEAISVFKESLEPKYIQGEEDKGLSKFYIIKILILQEKYSEALTENDWFLKRSKINARRWKNPILNEAELANDEILALREYQKTNNPKSIYDYIMHYKTKKYKSLPPSFEWGIGQIEFSTLSRLYDTIGDHSAGIKLIDEIFAFFLSKRPDIKVPANSEASKKLMEDLKSKKRDWYPYKIYYEYLSIREAFEKDKAEGTKGSATKALIQSDYFPW